MSIGYACLIISSSNDYKLKSCLLKNASDERLTEITINNLEVLERMIDYNIRNNIMLFRISSDIIPFASHGVNTQVWCNKYKAYLENIGRKIKISGMRVSMHPGQYTVLNSPKEEVVTKAVRDITYHVKFLEFLDTDCSNKVILHVGGAYGDKEKSLMRFKQNYIKLSQNIKDRLVLENDEKCYNIEEVLTLGKALNIPVVFDNLHHKVNPPKISRPDSYWISKCAETWHEKDGKQKIHYSDQKINGKAGAHSDTIDTGEFMKYYKSINGDKIDIMLEVKDKNLSALKCIHCIEGDKNC